MFVIGLRYSSQIRCILGRMVRAANSSLGNSEDGTTTSASTRRKGTFRVSAAEFRHFWPIRTGFSSPTTMAALASFATFAAT